MAFDFAGLATALGIPPQDPAQNLAEQGTTLGGALPVGAFNAQTGASYNPDMSPGQGIGSGLGESLGQSYAGVTKDSAALVQPGQSGLGQGSTDLQDFVGKTIQDQIGSLSKAQSAQYTDPNTGKPYQAPVPRTLGQNLGGSAHPLDLPVAIAGILAALSGRQGRNFAAGLGEGLLQQRQADTTQQNQTAEKQFQYDQQGRNAAVANAQSLIGSLSGMGYHLMSVEMKRQALAQGAERAGNIAIASALKGYDSAPTLNGKLAQAHRLQALESKLPPEMAGFAPTDDQATSDWRDLRQKQLAPQWMKDTAAPLKQFGMIPKSQEGPLEAKRQAYINELVAGSTNPDVRSQVEAMFPAAPTESTLAAQKQTEAKAEFDRRFALTQGATRQRLAQGWANLKVNQEKLDVARQNANTAQSGELNQENRTALESFGLQQRQYNDSVTQFNKQLEIGAKELSDKIKQRGEIDAVQAKFDNQVANDKKFYPNQAGLSPQALSLQNAVKAEQAKYPSVANVTQDQLKSQLSDLRGSKMAPDKQQPNLPGMQVTGGVAPTRGPGAAPRPANAQSPSAATKTYTPAALATARASIDSLPDSDPRKAGAIQQFERLTGTKYK